jgi:lipopolysaccharide/colanic/teichoic acid biosynthesis glycosyltransferase
LNQLVLTKNTSRSKKYYFLFKYGFDTLFSFVVLFFLLPLVLIVMIIIKIDSPGPIFFLQERIGKDGKPFKIIKFRTMYIDAEKNGPQWANKNDSRITNIGLYLRKYRIDEIPQLLNVISGDMSIIGPRPERLYFIDQFEEDLPHFRNRLLVKPGITGFAQTNGGYDLSPKEKLELDLYYIKKCSFLFDLKIVLKSVPVILLAKGWR